MVYGTVLTGYDSCKMLGKTWKRVYYSVNETILANFCLVSSLIAFEMVFTCLKFIITESSQIRFKTSNLISISPVVHASWY